MENVKVTIEVNTSISSGVIERLAAALRDIPAETTVAVSDTIEKPATGRGRKSIKTEAPAINTDDITPAAAPAEPEQSVDDLLNFDDVPAAEETVTKEMIAKLAAELACKGKKDQLTSLLSKYKLKNGFKDLAIADFAAFYKDLKALS